MKSLEYRKESDAVAYIEGSVPRLSKEGLHSTLADRGNLPDSASVRLCLHPDVSSLLHEMYILHKRGVYLRPHRHVDKDVSCVVLEGRMAVIFFDDAGAILETVLCDEFSSGLVFHVRIPKGRWHCQVVISPQVLFYEATTGPFQKSAFEYASFSPEVNTAEAERYAQFLW